MKLKVIFVLAVAIFLLFNPLPSKADTFTFDKITNNQPGVDIGSQLSVDVTASGGGVSFKFYNNVGTASNVTEIYFDDDFDGTPGNDLFSSISGVNNSSGVDFSVLYAPNPADLPGGNPVGFAATFAVDSGNGANQGVSSNTESVEIILALQSGIDINDVLTALNDEDLRIGLHVRSIAPAGESDSYVNNGPVNGVPEPASMLLFGSGLIGLAGVIRRRFKK